MRAAALIAILAGCGGDGGHPDGHVIAIDAILAVDASRRDAAADAASSDAAIPTSRVWVSGDWLADGTSKAGSFLEDATLPVVPSGAVPAGVDELAAGAGIGSVVGLDAGGDRVVYVAVDATGRSSLYLADGGGAGPPALVHAAAPGVTISSASISPDGLRIVFTADAELEGMFDLYLAAAAADTTPVKVSPDRAIDDPALDVAPEVAWSLTSRYLAFSGRLTEDGYDELFVADTAILPPTIVTLLGRADIEVPVTVPGARGVRGTPRFDHANEVWFRARIAGTAAPPFELFHASGVFGGVPTRVPMPARAGGAPGQVGAIAISADGARVAYAADAPIATAYEVYYAAVETPTRVTRITDGLVIAGGNPAFTAPMWFSPDGTRLALVGDLASAGIDEPFVLDVAGGSERRLAALAGDRDAVVLQWNAASTAVFCLGDLEVDGEAALFRLDPSVTQIPELAVAVAPNGDLTDLDVR